MRSAWSPYYSAVSALLLVLSVIAFSDNLFTDVGQPSNSDPKFIVHGLFGFAWYALLATQANLARVGSYRLHRNLGVAAFVVAVGVILSTVYVFVVQWKGWVNMGAEARANRMHLAAYAVCLLCAWRYRGDSVWHHRLVFVGTFCMLEPVLARTYDPLIMSWAKPLLGGVYTSAVDEAAFVTYLWVTWIGFFISLALYDLRTRKRVHAVTAAGMGWLALATTISLLFGSGPVP